MWYWELDPSRSQARQVPYPLNYCSGLTLQVGINFCSYLVVVYLFVWLQYVDLLLKKSSVTIFETFCLPLMSLFYLPMMGNLTGLLLPGQKEFSFEVIYFLAFKTVRKFSPISMQNPVSHPPSPPQEHFRTFISSFEIFWQFPDNMLGYVPVLTHFSGSLMSSFPLETIILQISFIFCYYLIDNFFLFLGITLQSLLDSSCNLMIFSLSFPWIFILLLKELPWLYL